MGTLHYLPVREDADRPADQVSIGQRIMYDIHQIKNSIATARGMLLLLKLTGEPEPPREFYDLIIKEINRANSLMEVLLPLARSQYAE
ncbi:MAG: hypothetical protein HPY50_18155 [Firmicutes bacterium]|nr:hypothetical protein [Bacillota bacterium]